MSKSEFRTNLKVRFLRPLFTVGLLFGIALESFTTIPMSDLVNGINAMEAQTGEPSITARQG